MTEQTFGPGPRSFVMLTGKLRWHKGALEQEYAFQDYNDYALVNSRYEWRPVPATVDAEEEPAAKPQDGADT